MPEHVPTQIGVVSGMTTLRLRSWLPERTTGPKPVVLAGQEFPLQVGAIASGPMRALCVGPGEWLIVSRVHTPSNLREYLEPHLHEHGLALVDLTDGLAWLEVRGVAARDLLSKGCGLDLHPRTFPPGQCARTRFAQIPLVMACVEEPSRFELAVARSYLHYLQCWLNDAAVEF